MKTALTAPVAPNCKQVGRNANPTVAALIDDSPNQNEIWAFFREVLLEQAVRPYEAVDLAWTLLGPADSPVAVR